jgi:hypothetical protein
LDPLLLSIVAPKILRKTKIIGIARKTLFSQFNFGSLISSEIFLFRLKAISQKINRKILKLTSRGINDKGLSIPTKGKAQLMNNPPNIKKAILRPIE